MELTPDAVARERDWVVDQADTVVPLVNEVRDDLGTAFDTAVPGIDRSDYREATIEVFAEGDRAVNVAALVVLLRELDVAGDYPGFIVDELLGRELAAVIAGEQPLRLLAEATFHYADVTASKTVGEPAGSDDLAAALAAGFQTRLPGWDWRVAESPFTIG